MCADVVEANHVITYVIINEANVASDRNSSVVV